MDPRGQFTFYLSFFESISRIKSKAARADAYDALCKYALYGIEPELDKLADAAAIAYISSKPNIDASRRKAESGKRGGTSKQTTSKPQANDKQTASEKENEDEKENEIEEEYECITPVSPSADIPKAKSVRHKYGKYGWVMLTDEEYDRLVSEYGTKAADDAIDYVDESAQSTGNKNRWKDWNLTVRRCIRDGWGQRQQAPRSAPQPIPGNPFDALRREVIG